MCPIAARMAVLVRKKPVHQPEAARPHRFRKGMAGEGAKGPFSSAPSTGAYFIGSFKPKNNNGKIARERNEKAIQLPRQP